MAPTEGSGPDSTDSSVISRRRLLQASGASAVALGLAGCQGQSNPENPNESNDGTTTTGGGDTTTEGGGGSGGTPVDDAFTTFTGADPNNSHYNPYNPSQFAGMLNYHYNQLWRYNGRTGEWHPRVGKELSIDGKTATITIDTAYKWSDGKSVNATDLELQLKLEQYIQMPVWDFITGVSKQDEQTLQVEMKEAYNPSIFRQAVNRHVQVKRGSQFEEWLSQFENAGSEDERSQVAKDFQSWQYAKDSNDPVTNGPYQISQRSSSKWVLEKNEHFPFKTNIPKFEFSLSSSDQQNWQKFIADRLDGAAILAVPSDVLNQFPDHIEQLQLPAVSCYSPMWQFKSPVWGKREARQAFAYLLDSKMVDRNINPRHAPLNYITGLTSSQTQKHVGEDWVSQNLTNYYPESKPEKAAEKFRQAGFQKQGENWVDENGNQITLSYVGPKFPGSVGFSETLQQVLPQFGIKYEASLLAPPQWISRRKNQDFDLTFNYIGGGPHPYYFLDAVINSTRSQFGNWPRDTVKLPPVGQPDGEQQDVDLTGLISQMVQTSDDAKLQELARQYAWYINQELPVNPMTESKHISYMSTDDWQMPSLDADVMGIKSPIHQLFRETEDGSDQALLQAKTE